MSTAGYQHRQLLMLLPALFAMSMAGIYDFQYATSNMEEFRGGWETPCPTAPQLMTYLHLPQEAAVPLLEG